MGHDYLSFIAVIASIYVAAGGIHLAVKGEATPAANVLFLLAGALLANVIGTVGASLLLIRPWLRANGRRLRAHHVIFFIFIVSNVGGCLVPFGNPPLFLGYLMGVPFWWVAEHCWPMWLCGVGFLLAVFYWVDRRNCRRDPAPPPSGSGERWRVEGLWNLLFLAVILGAVFISQPLFLREGVMLGAAAASWFTTRKTVHQANQFDFHPICEVAVLFLGIFATMIPALDWLRGNARVALGGGPFPRAFLLDIRHAFQPAGQCPDLLEFSQRLARSPRRRARPGGGHDAGARRRPFAACLDGIKRGGGLFWRLHLHRQRA